MSLMMILRILSWNVRGANDLEKRRIIKAFIKGGHCLLARDKTEGDDWRAY